MAADGKAPDAFRTIGELSAELGVAQHILRYWETRFPQLKPLQRAGNRRYYRPADVALVRNIHRLLSVEGYTVKGVQKLLRSGENTVELTPPPISPMPESVLTDPPAGRSAFDLDRLVAVRDRLNAALSD